MRRISYWRGSEVVSGRVELLGVRAELASSMGVKSGRAVSSGTNRRAGRGGKRRKE